MVLKRNLPVARQTKEASGKGRYKKAGKVGRVESAPSHREGTYLVRFADGLAVRARHDDLAVRRTIAPEDAIPDRALS